MKLKNAIFYFILIFVFCQLFMKSIIIFHMMEDKPLNNLELEKVTSRRSRKDE
jgi:hypothetical protein